MNQPEPSNPAAPSEDSEARIAASLQRVLQLLEDDPCLSGGQIVSLAAELQQVGVRRLVEERLGEIVRGESRST